MRVLVTGGRDYADRETVFRELAALDTGDVSITIVHGAARGADTLADQAAAKLGFTREPHPANWARLGKTAGFVRNEAMADRGADLCIAFPGGNGTRDMVARCGRHGIPVKAIA